MLLCYYSKGGFSWVETYSEIPVHLRKYYLKEVMEIVKKENTPPKEGQSGAGGGTPKISRPGVTPKPYSGKKPPSIPRKR